MKLNVVLGQDLSAYAEIEIEAPEDSSEEEIVRRVRAFTESANFDKAVFDEDWSTTCALRIVHVKNGNDYILEGVALEPSPYDGGQIKREASRGNTTFKSAINGAVEAAWIKREASVDVYRGTLTLPSAEIIEVEFECRKGATREEKDLAFLESLAQIGTVDYVAIGEVRHGV
jgi:hypothetical protein